MRDKGQGTRSGASAARAKAMEKRFAEAVRALIVIEGGYVFDPDDPGGETKYGISKRRYPNLDIKNLTRPQAKEIYRRDWWDKYRLASFQEPLDEHLLRFSVHIGPRRAFKLLQGALKAAVPAKRLQIDGRVGPRTRAALRGARGRYHIVAAALRSEAAGHYRVLFARRPAFGKYINGWLERAYA